MSRRNTYLLGGLAVVAGAVMIAFAIAALTSNGNDSAATDTEAAPVPPPVAPGAAPTPRPPADESRRPAGIQASGAEVGRQLSRRRPVRAPDFTAGVIEDGSIPQPLNAQFERATATGTLDLSRLRGTPVVLHLWSTQCAPCRANTRLVEATWKRWGPRGVLFVGVHVDEARTSSAKAAIRQYDLTYPTVSESRAAMARRFGATALPQAFFVSEAGDIVGQVVGSPSVRQLEVGAAATQSGQPFGSEPGSARAPL
jgi:AhpC/TSA family